MQSRASALVKGPYTERRQITNVYSKDDVRLTFDDMHALLKKGRARGDSRRPELYMPKDWWDYMYATNPNKYYETRHSLYDSVVCVTCANRHYKYGNQREWIDFIREFNECPPCSLKKGFSSSSTNVQP